MSDFGSFRRRLEQLAGVPLDLTATRARAAGPASNRKHRLVVPRHLNFRVIARPSDDPHEVRFAVHVRDDNRERTPPLVRLKALCGPGDEGEPVVTILMPEED